MAPDELRPDQIETIAARRLCGQDLEERKAARLSDRAADQVQDCRG
jgi:hypothetical protein